MSSEDENYEPGRKNNNNRIKNRKRLKSEVKPLVPQVSPANEEGQSAAAVAGSSKNAKPARRKSYLEKKRERIFRESGMKAGAIFKYINVTKKPDPDNETPSTSTALAVETDNNNILPEHRMDSDSSNSPLGLVEVETLEDDVEVSSSQDSDIIYVGCVTRKDKIQEVDIASTPAQSEGEDPAVDVGESNNDNDQVNSSGIDVDALLHDSDFSSDGEDFAQARNKMQQQIDEDESDSDVDVSPLLLPASPSDLMQQWDAMNKRRLEQDEQQEAQDKELGPSPLKASRFDEDADSSDSDVGGEGLGWQEDVFPQRPTSTSNCGDDEDEQVGEDDFQITNQDQHTITLSNTACVGYVTPSQGTSSPPLLKIVSVVGGVGASLSGSSTSTNQPKISSTASQEKVKKSIFVFREKNNASVGVLIGKKKWKEAAAKMKEDMDKNYHLPQQIYVSELIRNAILCETRVSKEVQKESKDFLSYLTKEYTASGDKENQELVSYYIGVFEKVYDDEITRNRLNNFLMKIVNRVSADVKNKADSNALWLLNIVTNLVVSQYAQYEKMNQKVKPPLLQNFIETEVGQRLKYECCQPIVAKLFENTTYDEFCIYLKWVDLLAKRFGYHLFKKEYSALVEAVAAYCEKREDLGLLIFLNSSHRSFAKDVCGKVVDKFLKVTYAVNEDGSQPNNGEVTADERNAYLEHLAGSKIMKPAALVVSNLKMETCMIDSSLTFYRPQIDCVRDEIKNKSVPPSGSLRNKYGETWLHKLLREENSRHEDVQNHLEQYPEDINAQDNYGNTPLHDCCKHNKWKNLIHLNDLHLRDTLHVPINFFVRNQGLETPVHLAASFGSEDLTNLLFWLITFCEAGDVLYTPNGAGKLPFELTTDVKVRKTLKPVDYDENGIEIFGGCALSPISVTELKSGQFSFAIKKLLAWWKEPSEINI